ncbi:MAG: hypothetical protein HOP33_16315 [Verrucomicrobia bacterium]|nr:hypothetical protein [Verrucomicrobiota bacterium]
MTAATFQFLTPYVAPNTLPGVNRIKLLPDHVANQIVFCSGGHPCLP